MIDPIAPTLLPLKYNNKPLARNLGAGDVAAQNDLYYKLFAAEPFTGKANEELPQTLNENDLLFLYKGDFWGGRRERT